jgi:hypothetical protein
MIPTQVFGSFETIISSIFGSMEVFALVVLFVFIIGFLFIGLDFRYALLIISSLALAMSNGGLAGGWLPAWVGIMMWIVVVTLGGYLVVDRIRGGF